MERRDGYSRKANRISLPAADERWRHGSGTGSPRCLHPDFEHCDRFLTNQAIAHRRTSFQSSRDARGLRTALLSELVLLKALIAENLALINRGEEYLLSCRMLTQIYRGNVGRLALLPRRNQGHRRRLRRERDGRDIHRRFDEAARGPGLSALARRRVLEGYWTSIAMRT